VVDVVRVPASLEVGEFRERFELPELPAVIAGGASHYRAVSTWTPEYLKRQLGHVVVPYKLSSGHQHPDFHAPSLGQMFAREKCSLAALLDLMVDAPPKERSRRLFTGDERYLLQRRDGQELRDAELSPLLDDVELPRWLPEDRLYTVWGWLSGQGVRTWLHYDNNYCHNLNAQLTGRKRCTLYHPRDLAALDPFPLGGPNPAHNCSRLDVEASDLPPAFRDLESYEADVQPGDLLFIPAFWLHTFLHLGKLNTNVNFWWRPTRLQHSPVSARQALLDAAKAAGLDPRASPQAETLRALDEALIGAR
jgi:Cupin-like domain